MHRTNTKTSAAVTTIRIGEFILSIVRLSISSSRNIFVNWSSSSCTIYQSNSSLPYLNISNYSVFGVQLLLGLVLDCGFRLLNIIIVEMVCR